jgi:phosphatidylinositol glycan class B
MLTPWLWVCVVVWRVIWTLFLVRSSFVPDEYWQGPEVAHALVFGYGELTWEWNPLQPLRSIVFPLLYALPLWLLRVLGCDSRDAVVMAPLVMQVMVALLGDWQLYHVASRWFGTSAANWALLLHLTSWCVIYCWSRTLSNTLEALLVLTVLRLLHKPQHSRWAYAAMVVAVVIRPTAALAWVLWLFCVQRESVMRVSLRALPVVIVVLGVCAALDWSFFGSFTLPYINFVRFNMGASSFYGSHQWHWYLTNATPTMLTLYLPFALIGIYSGAPLLWPMWVFLISVPLALSFVAHKEFRFLLPSLSVAIVYAGDGV